MNLYPIPRMVHLLQKDNSQNHYTSSYKFPRETFHQLIDDHICGTVLDDPNSMNIKSLFSVEQMPCEDRQFVIFSIQKKGRAMVSLDIFGDCNFWRLRFLEIAKFAKSRSTMRPVLIARKTTHSENM